MKRVWYLYAGVVVVALVVSLGLWNPVHVKAGGYGTPKFRVDPFWPKELPAPVGYNQLTWPTPTPGDTVAHRWVQGEVAGSCTDQYDNVYTNNRGWQVGAPVSGVTQNAESGGIDGNDATAALAMPSPPILVFDGKGNTIAAWGNPTLHLVSGTYGGYTGTSGIGRSAYMPYGSHGCFVDYQGYVWVGGNGDGIVQKYNPVAANAAGANATYLLQLGTKDLCDTTSGECGAGANNTSHTLLNEPADIAVDPERGPVSGTKGDIYVADGYGNYRVVVFNSAGTYVGQWGTSCGHIETPNGTTTPGNPCPYGTFGSSGGGHPHCVVLGNDGLVYVCDRPNSRIQVFQKSCAVPSTSSVPQPVCAPVRVIYIGTNGNSFPSTASPGKVQALLNAGTRACDIDFYPNVDYKADQSPTDQNYIVDVALDADNTFLLDKASGNPVGAFGRCGFAPCPGHNVAEFAYNHTTNVDSKGNVYVAETITGRRIQKFVRVDDDQNHH